MDDEARGIARRGTDQRGTDRRGVSDVGPLPKLAQDWQDASPAKRILTAQNIPIAYGKDGPIPGRYKSNIESAIKPLVALIDNYKFNVIFTDTLKGLGNTWASPDSYLRSLKRMVLNLADTSKTPNIIAQVQGDMAAAKNKKSLYRMPTAYSIPNGQNIWLREFVLSSGNVRDISGTILHELMHVAGAPGNMLAEVVLDRIHQAAGIPRVQ